MAFPFILCMLRVIEHLAEVHLPICARYLERRVDWLWRLPVSLDTGLQPHLGTVPSLWVALLSDMMPTEASPVWPCWLLEPVWLTVEGNVEVWDEPLSSLQGFGGKWLLLSVLGPQNGWNDPPALNRVPKKKKVMEKPSTQWMSLLLVTCSHVEHTTLNWSFSRQSLQINACTMHCTRISSNRVTGRQWQNAAKALPCAEGGLHVHPRLRDLGGRCREWLRSWDLAWAELTSLLSPCAWQPRRFPHVPCPYSISAQCTLQLASYLGPPFSTPMLNSGIISPILKDHQTWTDSSQT